MEVHPVYKKSEGVEIKRFFSLVPWELAFTGSDGHGNTPDALEEVFARWRTLAAKITGMQVAAMGVLTGKGHSHIHAVLVGRNRKNESLLDVDNDHLQALQKVWHNWTHSTAKIVPVRDSGWARYMVDGNLVHTPTARILQPFGMNLIKKLSL